LDQRSQPTDPSPDGGRPDIPYSAILVGPVAERNVLFLEGVAIAIDHWLAFAFRIPCRLQVQVDFLEDVLGDKTLVGDGKGRIHGKDLSVVRTAKTHSPGVDNLDHDLVQFGIVDAYAEFPHGTVIAGKREGW